MKRIIHTPKEREAVGPSNAVIPAKQPDRAETQAISLARRSVGVGALRAIGSKEKRVTERYMTSLFSFFSLLSVP